MVASEDGVDLQVGEDEVEWHVPLPVHTEEG
jgi:hypothetical protein